MTHLPFEEVRLTIQKQFPEEYAMLQLIPELWEWKYQRDRPHNGWTKPEWIEAVFIFKGNHIWSDEIKKYMNNERVYIVDEPLHDLMAALMEDTLFNGNVGELILS